MFATSFKSYFKKRQVCLKLILCCIIAVLWKSLETETELKSLNLSWNNELNDQSVIMRLSALVKESAEDFRGISYRLGRFGQVWSIVSKHAIDPCG